LRIIELERACPPMPARSTTRVRKPSDAPYTAAESPAEPAPTISRSTSASSGSIDEPVACVSSEAVGFESVVPSGRITTGSSAGGGVPSRLRPSAESASENACGNAQLSSTERSSYARPDHDSPTTWIA
jgi:hypothetical protein